MERNASLLTKLKNKKGTVSIITDVNQSYKHSKRRLCNPFLNQLNDGFITMHYLCKTSSPYPRSSLSLFNSVLGCTPQAYKACTCLALRTTKEPRVSNRDINGLMDGRILHI